MKKRIALTIAGSDSSGGAGIQADLKIFAALGVHGTTAITSVTAQNTQQVKKIYKLPADLVEKQIDAIAKDMQIDVVKTGMLYDKDIVCCVAKKIKQYNFKSVVDPVLSATSGDKLSEDDLSEAFRKNLLSETYVLTPNIHETNWLTGIKIVTLKDVKRACRELYEMGAEYVLIKGGHLKDENVQDVLYDGKHFNVYSLPRIKGKKAHGSGCTLSALIAGFLAMDEPVEVAVKKAKHILWNMIHWGYKLGKGADVLNHSSFLVRDTVFSFPSDKHFEVWLELKKSVEKLVSFLPKEFVPEVGVNIGYAIPDAKVKDEICAVNGRIIKRQDGAVRCGGIDFAASKHIASIILTAMNTDSKVRCAMNILYTGENIEKCKKAGFKIGYFNRSDEPETVASTMEWGTKHVVKKLGFVPDIIYDKGSIGKEPMIRILGENPKCIIEKLRVISGERN